MAKNYNSQNALDYSIYETSVPQTLFIYLSSIIAKQDSGGR